MSRKTNHISRLAAPSTWKVMRKSLKWIAKTSPGSRRFHESVPLVVLLRDVEGMIENKRELKFLLNSKSILINGKRYNDTNFPIGLFDVISFPNTKKHYRAVLNNKGKLIAKEISAKESNLLLLKISKKQMIRGGKLQMTLSNGWNVLGQKEGSVSDSVLYDLSNDKIKEIISYKSGAKVYFTDGKRAGTIADFKDQKELGILKRDKLVILTIGKETVESSINNLMVIGDKKEAITVK
jgi:small subunit ribosomal protein S4e